MKAINLIPSDGRGARGIAAPSATRAPAYVVLAFLGAAVALVTVYVLTSNTISDRQSKLTALKAQVALAQERAAGLGNFAKFAQVADNRVQTVRQISAARFSWDGALADLARVVPANTTLTTVTGSVVPGAGSGGSGSGSGLRGASPGPAFELAGCTDNQDDVAALMSRLRLINDVTRVTLSTSAASTTASSASSTSSSPGALTSGSSSGSCPANGPTFDLLVYFQPVPNAGAQGVASLSGSATSTGGKQ
jgi:Tfp pilus assembly protein PilN